MPVQRNIDDKELLLQIASGNERAFFVFYEHYYKALYPFLVRYIKNEDSRDDVIQMTFVKVWENREKLPEIRNIKAWVYTIASRIYLNHIQQMLSTRKREEKYAELLEHKDTYTPLQQISTRQINQVITEVVNTFSPLKKDIFLLSKEAGLKPAQIAEKLNVPVGTVKNQLSLALKQIRVKLSDLGYSKSVILFLIITQFY